MSRTEARMHLLFYFSHTRALGQQQQQQQNWLLFFFPSYLLQKPCWQTCQTFRWTLVLKCVRYFFRFFSPKWDLWSETLFNEGESSPHIYCSRWKKISSISPKMAADVGSMFQYWKKFDLRRLQVSAILTFLGLFLQRYVSPLLSGVCYLVFGANIKRKLAVFALIVIRNWSLFCLCSVQSLISGGATAEQQHSLR